MTQTDYEQMEKLAGERNVSEWARGVLLKELAGPDPFQLAVMEAFATLRYVLFNGLPWLAPEHLLSDQIRTRGSRAKSCCLKTRFDDTSRRPSNAHRRRPARS